MARTKIVIEIESEDEHFVRASGRVLVENARNLLKLFQCHVPSAESTANIVHDGKNVTEVIQ